MIRRRFISVTAITGVFLFSGCSKETTPSVPDKGSLWIANHTDVDQAIEVLIIDEDENTIFSDQEELAPDGTDDNLGGESGVGDVGSTYYVSVTTNDHQEEFEWEIAQNRSILNIYIENSEVRFERDAPEA